MKDKIITIENSGTYVNLTNYFSTPQATRGEAYLTWNAGCGRLLIPDSMHHLVREMRCNNVVVTKKQEGIHILFDDRSENPFRLVIAHEQNDREITPVDCEFAVYVELGEKYRFPCKCKIEHGNTGKSNAQKGSENASSQIQIRVTPRKKAAFVKQASRTNGGQKLSEWALNVLTEALDDDLKES